ncbi:DsbA family protein [Ancylobacter dichloromethanicus]|uniref:Disulfide bond formation protein DsbD n=1 Tax=Ancylobacter dichloromethanicus TaxID=518825 RepID=A0A9W6JEN2_9HYPH|nr:DsbA family protein [Ancylobacter dichloromethanicus]MBS7553423.1 DsbA family protein [Ancylobacter dichloromethanicus]GLK74344.1 disulfide bond formation protein DsbD [Ancylobacter dichloromethanicus]
MIDRRRFLEGIGTLALAVAAFSTFGTALTGPAEAQTVDTAKLMEPGALPDQVLGKADAPVTIVEYASMTCGHCAHFHETTFPVLKEKYIDTGKVRFILREFPLDIVAKAAFMLARCAGEGKYYPMTGTLFETQKNWAFSNNPAQALLAIAKQSGMTEEQFNACLNDTKLAGEIDEVAKRGATDFGIDSTPTFFINGKKVAGALSPEQLDKELAPLLGGN